MEDSHGNVGLGEREFIISPNLSSAVMSATTASQSLDSSVPQYKKPFDWMTDEQFHNLQVLFQKCYLTVFNSSLTFLKTN